MSAMFSSPPKPQLPPAVPEPKQIDLTQQNTALAEKRRMQMAQGYQSTMLTAGRDLAPPSVQKSTLGGT